MGQLQEHKGYAFLTQMNVCKVILATDLTQDRMLHAFRTQPTAAMVLLAMV
jgi:hypothetical protein